MLAQHSCLSLANIVQNNSLLQEIAPLGHRPVIDQRALVLQMRAAASVFQRFLSQCCLPRESVSLPAIGGPRSFTANVWTVSDVIRAAWDIQTRVCQVP